MQSERLKIKEFTEHFNIFRNKKGIKVNQDQWLFQDEYLKDMDIVSHLSGLMICSYYITHSTDIFCFDIDLHEKYLNDEYRTIAQFNKYNFITGIFGTPCLIFQSSKSRGLHLYYKMNQKILFSILKQEILKKIGMTEKELKIMGIEILPTPDKALKLPYAIRDEGALLNQELKYMFPSCRENADKVIEYILQSYEYDYYTLFNDKPELSDIWLKQVTRKKQYQNYAKVNRLEKYEVELLPELVHGNTNNAIERLSYNYNVNGLTIEQSTARTINLLDKKNIFRDTDLSDRRIHDRIDSHFKRFTKYKPELLKTGTFNTKDTAPIDLLQESLIQKAIDKLCIYMYPHPSKNKFEEHNRNQVLNKYKQFLNNLYKWTRYIESIPDIRRQEISYTYNYFYYYTKIKGLIPLPQNLMVNWNDRYNEIIDLLKRAEIIELKQKYYNPYEAKQHNDKVKGICNYYKVNL